jgi:HPt (histidine-containing phosphotransfer) domain-containing protein
MRGGVLDPDALEHLRVTAGDCAFMVKLVDTFLREAPALLETLRGALEAADAQQLRRAAHTLKSNGRVFGATRLAELCRELEVMAKAGTLMAAAELLPPGRRGVRARRGRAPGGGAGLDLIAAQASILIIDDEPLNRMLLSRDVERHGHLVAAVADGGGQALEALEPNHSTSSCSTSSCRKWPATRRSKCPEPDARLSTPYVELAHVDEVARRAQEGLASRIRNEN